MRWVVDCGPLSTLSKIGQQVGWQVPQGLLHVSPWVEYELQGKPAAGTAPNPVNQWILDAGVTVHTVAVPSPIFSYSEGLRTQRAPLGSDANRGECELIALCAVKLLDAIFVSQDKGACYLALETLGPGRVATPFDLWRDLIDSQGLDAQAWAPLCKSQPGPVPPRFRA